MKRVLIVVALVVLGAAGAWYLWPDRASTSALRITGNIEMTEVQVAFKTPGQVTRVHVEEGDPVAAGAALAALDDRELQRQAEEASAAVQAARGRLLELKAQRDFQRENVAGQIAEREAAVDAQRAVLAELLAGSRPQEIEDAQAGLERAQANLNRARSDYDRAMPLLKTEDISAQEFDRIESAFRTAQAEVRRAEQRLDLLREGPRKETIESARSRLEQAEAQLRLARSGELETKRLDQSISTGEAEVNRAQARVAQIQTRLADTEALSPVDGVVLLRNVEPGEIIGAGAPVLVLADQQRPWVRGYIPETALGRIQLGQQVEVRTDSYPGKTYAGTITYIADEAEFTPRQVLTPEERSRLVYRIKISLENPRGELKLNMPVDASIPLSGGNS